MSERPRFAYAQARLQARHGMRPTADEWRLAESTAGLAPFLDALRRTSLRRRLAGIAPEQDPEAIERGFRAAWRDIVDEAAEWCPPEWRDAIRWLRWLPDLPAAGHLVRGGKVPPWVRSDPVLRALAWDDPQRRREALAALPIAPLCGGAEESHRVADCWLEAWRDRLPPMSAAESASLEALVQELLDHREAMRAAEADGRPLRTSLAARLERRLRRSAGTVVALYCHLVLTGLELERARAGVLVRRILPARMEGRSWA